MSGGTQASPHSPSQSLPPGIADHYASENSRAVDDAYTVTSLQGQDCPRDADPHRPRLEDAEVPTLCEWPAVPSLIWIFPRKTAAGATP